MDYEKFLETKRHTSKDFGIEVNYMPDNLFDYQSQIVEYSVKKGRSALFVDTGLGKTIIELAIAQNYYNYTGKPTLIITPLAVAFQFVVEANKFGIDSVSYSKSGKLGSNIVICNYERLDRFDYNDFGCVILDESSILKNFKGKIKSQITSFLRKVEYKYLFTATPSPNDYIELGTSSEALGYLGYTDMLTKFFRNNANSIDAKHAGDKWYLKPHAELDFWEWVSTWALAVKKPSDIGFSDDKHKLPSLIENEIYVKNKSPLTVNNQLSMFPVQAIGFHDIKKEVRNTLAERCEAAVNNASRHETSVYWVNLNDESKLISQLDRNAVEIKGSMTVDQKEDILISFSKGDIKKLITKSSMTAFGLNWQHCNHTVYFPTYSYEQYYQSIRRFWRFGQQNDVNVDLVMSEGQKKIVESLKVKKAQAIKMYESITKNINKDFTIKSKGFDKEIILPSFL